MNRHRAYIFLISSIGWAYLSAQSIAQDSMYIRTFGTGDYRSSEINYYATEDVNGILFFANENGVLEYDGSHWQLHPIPDFSFVNVVEVDSHGKIYLGGRNEFGYMSRDSIGQMEYTSLRSFLAKEIELEEIWQIVFHGDQVYFQTYEGVVRWDGEVAHFIPIQDLWFLPMGSKLYVSVIEKGIGILVGDSVNYLNTSMRFEEDNPFELLSYKGREKILPTEFNGFYLIDTLTFETRKWVIEANELAEEYGLWSAKEWDDSTYLVTFINHSISWINLDGRLIKSLTKEDGIDPANITNFHKDSRGNLWIPSLGIHHVIWPEKQDLTQSKTQIRRINIDENSIQIDEDFSPLITDSEPLKDITIFYSVPGIDRLDLEYSTYLEGFDSSWNPWSPNAAKEYTNLSGGTYSFKVKSRFRDGAEFPMATIGINVPIPWHNTGWAKFGAGVMIWLMAIGLYKLRTLQLTQKNKRLELIVDERTEDLQKANEQLEIKNKELDLFVRRVSHDLVAPMKSVMALMEITQEEEDPEEKAKCFEMMSLSLYKQEQFVRKMLDQAVNFKDVKMELVNLMKVSKEAIESLSHFEGINEMSISLDFKEDFCFISDVSRVKIVVSNIITNAIKYRDQGKPESYLKISVDHSDEEVVISFEDNGIGIPKKEYEKIFEMFKRATFQSHGTGLGLYIARDMMAKLGGSIDVLSKEGIGTTFTISFPVTS